MTSKPINSVDRLSFLKILWEDADGLHLYLDTEIFVLCKLSRSRAASYSSTKKVANK